ncbi:MAG TPA: hypothetical protein VN538_12535 [Clostridia bacterium]|nr:hypothetical protein [Clostridia bacterium]
MSHYSETASEIDAWFERANKAAADFAAETKAPVIGYAWRHDHGKGSGYFRTDKGARFKSGSEIEPSAGGLGKQAAQLERMVAKMQKRGIRAEIYNYNR